MYVAREKIPSGRLALALSFGITLGLMLPASAGAQQNLKAGPYKSLAIRGVMIIPGHGGPAYGPADILIENDTIVRILQLDPVALGRAESAERLSGERVIEAPGMYVMPGMIDLHTHIREDPLPLDYVYYMKLAHGVTTMVHGADRGYGPALEQKKLSEANQVIAPRLYPIRNWAPLRQRGQPAPSLAEELRWRDLGQLPALARQIMAEGGHVVSTGSVTWNPELFGAVCKAVYEAGGITTIHLPPETNAVVDAVRAAELGVTMIEHHYGYAESALDRSVQDFPGKYNYNAEDDRFRHAGKVWQQAPLGRLYGEVVDRLVRSGVTMIPTMAVYEANRDINRAMGLPWHERYTHRALMEFNYPNPRYHGAYHWDWTSDDEATWAYTYRTWQKLIAEFNNRGGMVGYATDDNYIWATGGISNVRELQLLQEAGMHPLEVVRSATRNSARILRRPDLGLVETGYKADLAIVEGNPLENFRFLYAFGALTREASGKVVRKGRVRWTLKGGVVFENDALMAEAVRMVDESKRGWANPVKALFGPMSEAKAAPPTGK
jgi:hypothetical protein